MLVLAIKVLCGVVLAAFLLYVLVGVFLNECFKYWGWIED